MTERQLEAITLRAFFNKLKGFRSLQREDWERTRAQTYLMLSPYFEKGSTVTPMEIMPFPWDGTVNTIAKIDPKKMAEDRKKGWAKIDAMREK